MSVCCKCHEKPRYSSSWYCYECLMENRLPKSTKERREKNKLLKSTKERGEKNRLLKSAKDKRYKLTHSKKYIEERRRIISKKNKERYINNKEKYREYHRINQLGRRSQTVLHNVNYRCNNHRDRKYKYYGGRGIKNYLNIEDVKWLWIRDYTNDLQKPSIDRIDSDGDYIISNCRFIEFEENRKR